MKTSYFLKQDNQEFFLFELDYLHLNEEVAVSDFELAGRLVKDARFEDVVRVAYTNQFKRSLSQSSAFELLKLLLANGCSLRAKNANHDVILARNFYPVKYWAVRGDISQGIGNYYYTMSDGVDEQFPRFCTWLDELCGYPGMGHGMTQQMVAGGFSVKAETTKYINLLEVSISGEIVSGQEFTLQYLTGDNP